METVEQLLEKLEYQCKTYDRYYWYSDDHRVWQRGEDHSAETKRIKEALIDLGATEKMEEVMAKYAS